MRSIAPSARPAASGHTPRRRVGRVLAVAVLVIAGLVVTATTASAETTHVVALARSVDEVLNNIRNWLMGILALLATVFLTIGGVRYVLANGDPSEVEKAKQSFKSAGFGYGLAALAPLVVEILKGIVGA
ncbi:MULTISPECIES: pilin [Pseudonocardiaceae]|uniref:Pilin n=1 Tax=Saccharopolyspora cebuensis TaxID=418759 RepID=A0ABV4CL51_9PSEU|nr:pilin [Pseudonocardia sp. C8]